MQQKVQLQLRKLREGESTDLIRRQDGEGLDDGSQRHLGLLCHVGGTRHVVSRAANKPRAGVPYKPAGHP